ncbi:hypothetical protein K9N68_29165 [Kovacikia minuta CCNUW1]|uniref:hypothetical protein n=1 Tax=Kovacikia minuta TaxID=2931930 RepID=UPI001CCACAA4|nr:hypothetical protein [Kovacikia minuta]UBF25597.1 hypothetical protein K9N68_29165 [Kovacikia minuta CCNUW1]
MNSQSAFLLILSLVISSLAVAFDSSAQVNKQLSLGNSSSLVQPHQSIKSTLHSRIYRQPRVGVPGRREGAGTR